MGSPVKIIELAKSMIRLHESNQFSMQRKEIKKLVILKLIEVFGLRPGEKLYEELLISGVPEPTTNPKIFGSNETAIDSPKLKKILKKLKEIIDSDDEPELLSFLKLCQSIIQNQNHQTYKIFLKNVSLTVMRVVDNSTISLEKKTLVKLLLIRQ